MHRHPPRPSDLPLGTPGVRPEADWLEKAIDQHDPYGAPFLASLVRKGAALYPALGRVDAKTPPARIVVAVHRSRRQIQNEAPLRKNEADVEIKGGPQTPC